MSKYIELIDKYRIEQHDTDYNPPSYIWQDNTGEIVRCKDCKNWREGFPGDTCALLDGLWGEDDYCSKGDKRDE